MMRHCKTHLLTSALFLSLCLPMMGAVYCVKQGGAGDGSSWSSPLGSVPSSQVSGATYYLAAGTYGSLTIGSSGVTIKKATVSDHGPATGWNDSFASGTALFNNATITVNAGNVTIDGVTGGGPGSWTSGYGIKVKSPSPSCVSCINANSGASGLTVRHVELEGDHGDGAGCGGNSGIVCYCDNVLLSRAYIHDMGLCLMLTRRSNFTAEYIYGGWYEYVLATEHSEILVADAGNFPSSPDTTHFTTGIVIRNSIFTVVLGTGGLMFQCDGVEVYGNVFYNASTNTTWDYCWNGCFGAHDSGALLKNIRVYHNTFFDATRTAGVLNCNDPSASQIFGQYFANSFNGPNYAYNNLFYKNSNPALGGLTPNGSAHDYNCFMNLTRGALSEAHSVSTSVSGSPFVNEAGLDFRLNSNVSGKALDATYNNVDPNGNVRSSHTMGAYEFGSASAPPATNPVPVVSPQLVYFPLVATNTSQTNTIYITNSGSGTLVGTCSVGSPFFVVGTSSYSLGSNQGAGIKIRYSPTSAAFDTNTINFTGNVSATATAAGSSFNIQRALTFNASTGTIASPFSISGTNVSQTDTTVLPDGGVGIYGFKILSAGTYYFTNVISATGDTNNSIYWAVDAFPTNEPYQVWDPAPAPGFVATTMGWRGNGTFTNNQFPVVPVALTPGNHALVVIGREGSTILGQFSIGQQNATQPPPAPQNLRVVSVP